MFLCPGGEPSSAMSEIETKHTADEAANDRNDTARLYDLKTELSTLDDVHEVEILDDRRPARVRVVLDVANVTGGVEDLLDEYDAVIQPDGLMVRGDERLAFEVATPEGFKTAGQREVRPHGSSLVVTLTRESLDLSGFDEGTPIDEEARDGAILLTESEA